MTTRTDAALAADTQFLSDLARQLRADSIRCSIAAASGHPTSAMSAADLMAVLLAPHLRYDWDNPGDPGNDPLGAAVLEALAGAGLPLRFRQCAVSGLPGSGTPEELMGAAGISAPRIAAAARELLKGDA